MSAKRDRSARRLNAPSWLDFRLILGLLMVLVAVVVGARVVAGADKSTTVWGVSRDLAPGTTITADDLSRVRIRLYSDAARYLGTGRTPVGLQLNRQLRAGDLLPATALTAAPARILVPLAVSVQRMPRGLTHGDTVDVYVGSGSGEQTAVGDRPVVSAVTVQSVSGAGSGALSASSSTVQVTIAIPPEAEAAVVPQLTGGAVYLVQHLGANPPAPAWSTPSSPAASRSAADTGSPAPAQPTPS